jgi:hypothetical protein
MEDYTLVGANHSYLVLIDQQSVGKRSLYLMDTVNAKTRWTNISWRVNNF